MYTLTVTCHTLPIAGEFRISRSALNEIDVVRVHISDGHHIGRGECRPYSRYGETPGSVCAEIKAAQSDICSRIDMEDLKHLMPAGAARNAVDCALWDLNAKQSGTSISELLNLPQPRSRKTAYTISLDTPEAMARVAVRQQAFELMKIKVGAEDAVECAQAILAARPDVKLIIDANEALTLQSLSQLIAELPPEGIALIEQPLPAQDIASGIFTALQSPIPICADESLHTRESLPAVIEAGYTAVNIKLDKTGGLTEALAMMKMAKSHGLPIMAGCMVSSSLAMAPMMYLESFANFIDLDGPLLLASDIEHGLNYANGTVYPPTPLLWG